MIETARPAKPTPPQVDHLRAFKPSKVLAVFGFTVLSGVFAASLFFSPPDGDYFTVCGFKHLTGLPCPGCGLTHAFCAIGKARVLEGFEWNLLGPPLFLLFILLWIRSAMVLLNRTRFVSAFDGFAERFGVARWFFIAFITFGAGRIGYVLLMRPEAFCSSPVARWVSGVFG